MSQHLPPDLLQFLKDQREIHDNLRDEIKQLRKEVKPMVEWFSNITFMKKFIMWALTFLASVGGLILLWRELYK